MGDFNTIASQFVEFYYKTFDTNRSQLASLYQDTSMLSFENSPFQGAQNIVTKLQELPFQKVEHRVTTMDAQPLNQEGGILVLVTGALMVDEQPQPMNYVQTFTLLPANNNYWVQNDVFRLVYPAQ